MMGKAFWRSVDLTGNQTSFPRRMSAFRFWCSVNLTGNQTCILGVFLAPAFWRSVDLTGNQTYGSRLMSLENESPRR